MPTDAIQFSFSHAELQVLQVLLGRLTLNRIQPKPPMGLPGFDLVKDGGLKPEEAALLLPRIREVLGFAAVDGQSYQNEITLSSYFAKRLGKDQFDAGVLSALIEPNLAG